jgi:LEA14-like dessication related protein
LKTPLTYKLLSINPGDLTAETTQVIIGLRIFSQSTLDADIQDIIADLWLNYINIGTIESVEPFVLPAKGYSDAKIRVTFHPKQLTADAVKLANSYLITRDLAIKLAGNIKIKMAGLINATVPFNYETNLKELKA